MDLRQYAAAQDFTETPPEQAPAPILAREQAQEAQERTRAAEVYKKYQENIKAAGAAQTALRKGILAGASPYRLLLLATECIGHLLNDTEFIEGSRSDLKLVYGELLGEPGALEIELEEVEGRLAKLRAADTDPEKMSRVYTIIREHERRAEELRKRIS